MTGARSVRRSTATFKPRRRRLSPKRRADLTRWLERWGVAVEGAALDWTQVFGRAGTVVLDVGFGHGESVLDLARTNPEVDVLGVEVHTPGVATLLEAVERDGLTNVRVSLGDVLPLLDRIPAGSLAEIRVFFPDPWPKERQHHRRLVRSDVVAAFVDRLRIGGRLRLATDVAEYAQQMIAACESDGRLRGGTVEPTDRPLTRFERRAAEEGRPVTDLAYRRIA
jgi:tRNA (guanine-N7-)-methyltransferase